MSANSSYGTTYPPRRRTTADAPEFPRLRGLVDGYAEIAARIADAADRFVDAVADNDAQFGARSVGDAIRQAPEVYRRTALALNDSLIDVLDLRNWRGAPATRAAEASRPTAAPVRSGLASEADIVTSAHRYIARGRQGGATLDGLLRHLHPQVGISEDALTALISRYFLVDKDLVFLSRDEDPNAKTGFSDGVEEHLKALGYTDLRRDVPLARARAAQPARLVAYQGNDPVVLVFRAPAGRLADPQTDEDARFQAKALSQSSQSPPPRYIYFTDGRFNRYLDLSEDRVLAALPGAPLPSAGGA